MSSLSGTRVYIAATRPILPPKVLENENGSNASEVLSNTLARKSTWRSFDTPNTFIEIEDVITVGDIGASFNINTTTLLKNGLQNPSKGSVSAGSGSFSVLYNPNDPGQKLLRRFGLSYAPAAFRINYSDAEVRYFIAHIGGDAISGGDADANKECTAELTLKDFQEIFTAEELED